MASADPDSAFFGQTPLYFLFGSFQADMSDPAFLRCG
jgi:hypothetical protein